MLFKKIYYKLFKDKAERKDLEKIDLFEIKYKKLISETNNKVNSKNELNFLHSGTSGDLIYALAVMNKISLTRKCNFYINVNKKFTYDYYKHNGEGYLISERMFDLLLPLLKKQKFLNIVKSTRMKKLMLIWIYLENYHGIIHLTHPDGIFILLVNRKI